MQNIANTFTSVYPYAIYRGEENERIVTISGFVVDSEHATSFAHRRVLPVDFSREFERDTVPTEARLRELALAYIKTYGIGVPRVSISLSFVDLTKTINASGMSYERLNLCDEVPVRFEKLGIETVARVVRVQWNVLLDQYDRVEIGETRASLGDRLREIERGVNEANHASDTALTAANGKNTVFFGATPPNPPFRIGDLWYRSNGEHIELWTWEGNGWAFVMSTAPDEVLLAQIEENRRIVEASNERVNQAVTDVESALDDFEEQRREMLGSLDQMNRDILDAKNGEIHGSRIVDGTIVGDKIANRTLTMNQLFLADASNLVTINEIIGSRTNVLPDVLGGTSFTANASEGSIGGDVAQIRKRVALDLMRQLF